MKVFKTIDVTLKELSNLSSNKYLAPLFQFLDEYWYYIDGKRDEGRTDKIRIGSIDIGFDDANHLVIKFVTRFSLTKEKEALKKFVNSPR